MTLLLREVAGFVAEVLVWLAALSAIGTVAARLAHAAARHHPSRSDLFWGALGAAAGAALAHRVGAPSLWAPQAGRELPVDWAVLGAVVTGLATALSRRRSPAAASPPAAEGQHQG